MHIVFDIIALLLAGMGAGVVTALMAASAVLIAAPVMIVLLGYDPFVAIGVSLAIDVFASAITAKRFHKFSHIRIKPAILILLFAVIGAYIGSYYSASFNEHLLTTLLGSVIIISGASMLRGGIKGEMKFLKKIVKIHGKKAEWSLLVIAGLIVGLLAGIFGAGGGVTLLIILSIFLGYRIHTAIGTSVFIMIFIALSGAVGHIIYGYFHWYAFLVVAVGGVLGAHFTAKKTMEIPEEKLTKIIGLIFFCCGFLLVLNEIILIL